MTISVIIPTFNEASNIGTLIQHLKDFCKQHLCEIIVADGGSTDQTVAIAENLGVKVIRCKTKGRACQMNEGAKLAKGTVLHFIHADTIPPIDCFTEVISAIQEGYPAGCFTFQFDSPLWLLKINSYCTRFNKMWCRGGDQTLFITKALFEKLGGYRQDFIIMEEYDLIKKIYQNYTFKVIQKDAKVSARKYLKNGYFRVQIANLIVFNMYRLGFSQQKMFKTYQTLLS